VAANIGEAEALGLAVSPTPSGISDLDDPDVTPPPTSMLTTSSRKAPIFPITPEDESPAAQMFACVRLVAPAAADSSKRGVYIAGRGEPAGNKPQERRLRQPGFRM